MSIGLHRRGCRPRSRVVSPHPRAHGRPRRVVFSWRGDGREPRCASAALPRTMAIRPVRTSSTIPNGRIRSMNDSILCSWPLISTITSSVATSTIRPRKISASSRISLRRPPSGALDLDQHQIALDEILRADVDHLDDGHDFFELLADLPQHVVVAHHDKRHPRQVRDPRFRRPPGCRCCSRATPACPEIWAKTPGTFWTTAERTCRIAYSHYPREGLRPVRRETLDIPTSEKYWPVNRIEQTIAARDENGTHGSFRRLTHLALNQR